MTYNISGAHLEDEDGKRIDLSSFSSFRLTSDSDDTEERETIKFTPFEVSFGFTVADEQTLSALKNMFFPPFRFGPLIVYRNKTLVYMCFSGN